VVSDFRADIEKYLLASDGIAYIHMHLSLYYAVYSLVGIPGKYLPNSHFICGATDMRSSTNAFFCGLSSIISS
jgi:hypothetical protein